MKKCNIVLIVLVVLTTVALPVFASKEDSEIHAGITIAAANTRAASSGEQERGQGADDSVTVRTTVRESIEALRQGTVSGIEEVKNKSGRTIAEVRENRTKSHEALNATLRNISSGDRDRIKNENEVRIAVTTLLDTEDLSGSIGRNVSAIARDFNNSAGSIRKLEDRIQSRNSFVRLLFGGDQEAARELATQIARNNASIVELQQLINGATLETDVRATMEDQIRILLQEQERLQQLATREQQDRGIFGRSG
jgi:hypothetical protein